MIASHLLSYDETNPLFTKEFENKPFEKVLEESGDINEIGETGTILYSIDLPPQSIKPLIDDLELHGVVLSPEFKKRPLLHIVKWDHEIIPGLDANEIGAIIDYKIKIK